MLSTLVCSVILISTLLVQDDYHSIHHPTSSTKVDYDSLYAEAAVLSESPEGRELLASCMERYGGADKLARLKSVRLVYSMESKMGSEPLTLIKSLQWDRMYKTEVRGKGRNEVRILNGNEGWLQNPDAIVPMEPSSGRYMAEFFSYLTLALPVAIERETFAEVRFGKRPDDPLGYVYLKHSDALLVAVGIDPETHLIRSSEGVVQDGEQTFIFVANFSEHRDQDGFLFPGKVEHISMGLNLGTSTLTKIEVNPEFDATEFRPRGS